MASQPEAWQRGPLSGVDPYLMPAAHALVQASEDLEVVAGLSREQLLARPGGIASLDFHLRHLAAATERLLTYARGRQLTPEQLAQAAAEKEAGASPDAATLVAEVRTALEQALAEIRATPRERLLEPREVGRARLPSNVIGLLGHIAEHASRHLGQITTTARLVRSL